MGRLNWAKPFLLVLAAVTIVTVFVFFSLNYGDGSFYSPAHWEKASISQVTLDSTNPKNFSISVTWISTSEAPRPIVFTEALFKNATRQIVARVNITQGELAPDTERTLTVYTETGLPSGVYTVALTTEAGSVFVSPSFCVEYPFR